MMYSFVEEIYLDANVFKKCISFYSRYKFFFKKLFHLLKGNFEVQVNTVIDKKISYILSDALSIL